MNCEEIKNLTKFVIDRKSIAFLSSKLAVLFRQRRVLIKVNALTAILALFCFIFAGSTFFSYISWLQLKNITNLQSSLIAELAKSSKENPASSSFAQELANTNRELKELALATSGLITSNNNKAAIPATVPTPTPTPVENTTLGLSTLQPPDLLGTVNVKNDPSLTFNVYEKPDTASSVVEVAKAGDVLFYYQKQSDWYQVELESTKFGWIQAIMVTEFPK